MISMNVNHDKPFNATIDRQNTHDYINIGDGLISNKNRWSGDKKNNNRYLQQIPPLGINDKQDNINNK